MSLLSNIDKITEKIIYNRTYKFTDKNNITHFPSVWLSTVLFNFICSGLSDLGISESLR